MLNMLFVNIEMNFLKLYPVHGDKNHHRPDIFIGENIDTLIASKIKKSPRERAIFDYLRSESSVSFFVTTSCAFV